jgi:hypothetical protein
VSLGTALRLAFARLKKNLCNLSLLSAWGIYYLGLNAVVRQRMPSVSDLKRCLLMHLATSLAGLAPFIAGRLVLQGARVSAYRTSAASSQHQSPIHSSSAAHSRRGSHFVVMATPGRVHFVRVLLSGFGHLPALLLHAHDTRLIRTLTSVATASACLTHASQTLENRIKPKKKNGIKNSSDNGGAEVKASNFSVDGASTGAMSVSQLVEKCIACLLLVACCDSSIVRQSIG